MFVLGLQASPRLKGNSNYLLSVFMEAAKKFGADTQTIHVDRKNILPCKEYIVCEKRGYCPIDDDMKHEIYPLIRHADVVVVATPIFFYNTTAQMKALIDRCQTFWARKYRLKLKDPGGGTRRGFLMAAGATRGKNLFEGLKLTAAYFFDAIDAKFEGSLTYPGIEKPGDMQNHPGAADDVAEAVDRLLKPFAGRKRILFVCRDNACLSQMAGAFLQHLTGGAVEGLSGGIAPAVTVEATMESAMRKEGIDMAFRTPRSVKAAIDGKPLDGLIAMGDKSIIARVSAELPAGIPADAPIQHWDLSEPVAGQRDAVHRLRDEVKDRVSELIDTLDHP